MNSTIPALRAHFPILARRENGCPLVYLDSATTAQKPLTVLEAMTRFLREDNGGVHRGMHPLAERATQAYEWAREAAAAFIRAAHADEIIFTRGTTEAMNLLAISLSRWGQFQTGDRIVLSELEHHSNIVPWQQLAQNKKLEILWLECDHRGQLDPAQLKRFLVEGNVRLLAITAQSNVLGVRPPLEELISLAHRAGALTVVDAAQAAAHYPMDVRALGCDFLAFSGHKIYGPTGIGVLYGRRELLADMPPYLGGGSMIRTVTKEGFTPADPPQKFEAGTPPVMEAVGLHAAMNWLSRIPWKDRETHERALLSVALDELRRIPGLKILGPGHAEEIAGCISFVVDGVHPHDLTEILGRKGVCLRAGHQCAQPLHDRLGIVASTRLSVGIYNNEDDIRSAVPAIQEAITVLKN